MATVALVYDFDGTLSPHNMQEYGVLGALHLQPEAFWGKVQELQRRKKVSQILGYMWQLLEESHRAKLQLTRSELARHGAKIDFFPGVVDWFDRTRKQAASMGLQLEHNIISSGLEEMIEGCRIRDAFDHVFASSYLYNEAGCAVWPRLALDYTLKTQFLFRISKGAYDVSDDAAVNEYMSEGARHVPFSRIVYLGDGMTDVPCMRLVKQLGGYSLAVYNETDPASREQAQKLVDDQRVQSAVPADYTENSQLSQLLERILSRIAAETRLERFLGFH